MVSPTARGHGEQGWLSSPGTGSPQHPATLKESTFNVLSEPDSSELSCTSMSGSWYLQKTGLRPFRGKHHNAAWRLRLLEPGPGLT